MITVLPPSYAGPLQAVHCGLGGYWNQKGNSGRGGGNVSASILLTQWSQCCFLNLKLLNFCNSQNFYQILSKKNIIESNPVSNFKYAVSNSQNCLMLLHKGSGKILLTYLTRVKRVQLLSLSHIAVTTILMLVRIVTAPADATVVLIPGFSNVCVQTLMSQHSQRLFAM